ncbi:hypothetical protein CK203_044164 [Vitis vinifera]|uniref:Uncharacterized protein n=1 Tax=Vitis vinifera TaxID=29760 RepID=A0A438I2P8_VITVI|nr:hypothetical protein CK203_044164 [Vitis vinifera]
MSGRQYILSRHIVRIIDCSKQSLLSHPRQPAIAHVPPPAERKDKNDGRSSPTISDSCLQGDDAPATTLNLRQDVHTFQRRSSAKGDEDYHEWLEAIERRQLESERQMQALLQEIARLREENVVLQIQASSTGPPRGQRSRGQGANSRPELESIYLETAGAIPESWQC